MVAQSFVLPLRYCLTDKSSKFLDWQEANRLTVSENDFLDPTQNLINLREGPT